MWTGGQVVDGEPRMMFALTHMRRIHGTRIVCDVNRTHKVGRDKTREDRQTKEKLRPGGGVVWTSICPPSSVVLRRTGRA